MAAVALGVFSLGIVPLICRLALYDKSFRVVQADEQNKVTKVAEKLQTKEKNKEVKQTKADSSTVFEYSKMNSYDLNKKVQDLAPFELAKIVPELSDEQVLGLKINSKAKFDAVYGPNSDIDRTSKLIGMMDRDALMEVSAYFSSDLLSASPVHYAFLTDEQAKILISLRRNKKESLREAVQALFINDKERFSLIDLGHTEFAYIQDLLPTKMRIEKYLQLNNPPSKVSPEVLNNLETLSPEELQKVADDLTDAEVLDYDFSKMPNKEESDLEKIMNILYPNKFSSERPANCIPLLLPKQIDTMCNGFSMYHWSQITDHQFSALDFSKIKNENKRKDAINKLLEGRFRDLDFGKRRLALIKDQPEKMKIIKENLNPDLREELKEFFPEA